MLASVFRPLTTVRTWYFLVHGVTGVLFGALTFAVIITLLATSVGLLITFLLALPVIYALFAVSRGLGAMERSRASALLDVHVSYPHPPLTGRSWFSRLYERVRTGSRWREIAYHLLLLPIGTLEISLISAVWCGSAALVGLPFYVSALPGDSAEFGLFDVGSGPPSWVLALVGVAGLAVVAPWVTWAIGTAHGVVVRTLLGPSRHNALAEQVTRIEASRVAAVDSAESERRRIERDLHDGAQQRLVALAMDLGMARERFDDDPDQTRRLVEEAHEEAKAALGELRDLVRGFHPAILEDRGLDAALSAVIARSSVPVQLDVDVAVRPPATVESAAYFIVTEALTNVVKHSGASSARVAIVRRGDRLVIDISDNGGGGADATKGSGLHGLAERVQALGGWMSVMSPAGGPTTVLVELPCAS